ncbi:MAG: DUF3047 domain-containing protein [Deltaproteobacteria bacterium]|nr:DUF3047 domain-containing protein [Deltaproteobacteria bacterium]
MTTRIRKGGRRLLTVTLVLVLAPAAARSEEALPKAKGLREVNLEPSSFQVVKRDSGPVNYYSVVDDPTGAYLRSAYKPPYETAVLGYAIPDDLRRRVAKIQWKWRAITLPKGGNECAGGKGDSAAVVYLTWKRGLRWYVLKYVWSATGTKGAICDKKRNLFQAQETIIVESGGPLNEWKTMAIDPDEEFRKHFEDGDPKADVPDLGGVGLMSDGDQTQSESSADWSGFAISYR